MRETPSDGSVPNMMMFDNKLIKSEKVEEEGLEADADDLGSSMVEAQKSAIVSLSKQEKLLLLELQKTRMSIVDELEQLDPQISADNWRDVQSTIANYQEKIVGLAAEETMDGQKRRDRFQLPGSPVRNKGSPTMKRSHGSHFNMSRSSGDENYESVTNSSRYKTVMAAANVPVSRIRTAVDMLPVFTSNPDAELDRSIRMQTDIRMPTFKLPELDKGRIAEVLEQTSGIPGVLREEKVEMRAEAPVEGKKKLRLRFNDALDYTEGLYKALKGMGPMDVSYLMQELGISHNEWASVHDELKKRVELKVTVDTDELVQENTEAATVFAKAKRLLLDAQPAPVTAPDGGGLDGGPSVLTAASSVGGGFGQVNGLPVLGSSLDSSSIASGLGGGPSRANMSRSLSQTRFNDMASVKSGASRKSYGSKARSMAGKSRAERSVASSMDTSALLKTELVTALRNMQHHTVGVKSSIANVQELAAVGNPRAKAMMHSIAAERMQEGLRLVIKKELRRGWAAWVAVNTTSRRQECTKSLTRMLGLRLIAQALNAVVHKVLQRKLNLWIFFWKKESAHLKRQMQTKAAVTIQCEMRAYLAKKRVRLVREQIKYRRLYAAVIVIQSQFRGRATLWKYKKYLRGVLETKSSSLIQRTLRGHRARKRVRVLRMQRDKHRATRMIQKIVRGRQGRNRYAELNKVRIKNRAAVKMTALVRGFLARRTLSKILLRKLQLEAILVISARWRGAICRMSMGRKRKELMEYKEMRFKAARDVQRVFRGYKSRLGSRMKMIERERKNRKFNIAATTINTMIRGFLAKKKVESRRRDHNLMLLNDARMWKEGWSEEAEAWFYLNESTGEDLWEPPASGYTKHDGSLVLANGVIVEDPDVLEARELEKKKMAETLCCECDERAAIKFCRECGDKYCTPCYRNSHATGTRRKHNPEPLGPLDCNECEQVLGIRWCIACDECYCDGCWRKVHSHGKRRFHAFSEVNSKGRIDSRVLTIDGSESAAYDATYPTQMNEYTQQQDEYAEASAEYTELAAAQEDFAAQWVEYTDDDGYTYYYNTETGESTYDNPFEQQSEYY